MTVFGQNNDILNNRITDGIYEAWIKNKRKSRIDISAIPNAAKCTSDNLKAVAEANYNCYRYHEDFTGDMERCKFYREKWLFYNTAANEKENEEFNIKKNSKDAKKIWNLIDWKGKIS